MASEAPALKSAENWCNEIIDWMCLSVDVDEHCAQLKHLSKLEQQMLAVTLKQCPEIFKGQIGALNIPPVHFELKLNELPHHSKAFPMPKQWNASPTQNIGDLRNLKSANTLEI